VSLSPTAALIIIGNEVLSGKVQDLNIQFLARRLFELGVELRSVAVIPDEEPVIAESVRTTSALVDYVFTTGGLGPTHDDVTLKAVAQAFSVSLVHSPTLESLMQSLYGFAPSPVLTAHCHVPEGAELLHLPGASYPQLVMHNVYLFPGVPELVRRKFELIVDRFAATPFLSRSIALDASELQIVAVLDQAVADHPQVRFGSYPSYKDGKESVLLTLDSLKGPALDDAEAYLRKHLAAYLVA
jgi:molybdenum cofactor synthesis domain-containing protein